MRADTCTADSNATGNYQCSVTYDSLTYDEHAVAVKAVNQTGQGPAANVTVDVRSTQSTMALTATFSNVPPSHDGSPFRIRLDFSEAPNIGYRTVRDRMLTVQDARVTRAQRVTRNSNQSWWITIAPNEVSEIDIELPATLNCSKSGAVCTTDGRMLSEATTIQVIGVA